MNWFAGSSSSLKTQEVASTQVSNDSIASLSWAPNGPYLASTSWDGEARAYQVDPSSGRAEQKLTIKRQYPLLSSCWTSDGTKVLIGSADKELSIWDIASNQFTKFGSHNDSVSFIKSIPEHNLYVSGGWDGALHYHDLRSPNPVKSLNLNSPIIGLDVRKNAILVCLASLQMHAFMMPNVDQPVLSKRCSSIHLPRAVALSNDLTFFVEACIEGRCALHSLSNPSMDPFRFKCAHNPQMRELYATNVVSFHPNPTGGYEGIF
ncbi:hypothetical protein GEMRC1_004443 [Eukaryota sp. GEM-RC1]